LIRAATTSLLASPNGAEESAREQLKIADEEAEHLRELIGNAGEMARLDTAHIEVHPEISNLQDTVQDVLVSLQTEIGERRVCVACSERLPAIAFDRRLMNLAIKQLLDNAIRYSPQTLPLKSSFVKTAEECHRKTYCDSPSQEQRDSWRMLLQASRIKPPPLGRCLPKNGGGGDRIVSRYILFLLILCN